jgi:hypothetical protein
MIRTGVASFILRCFVVATSIDNVPASMCAIKEDAEHKSLCNQTRKSQP